MEANSDVKMDCSVRLDGSLVKRDAQEREYAAASSDARRACMTEEAAWKKEGCVRETGGVGGKTP